MDIGTDGALLTSSTSRGYVMDFGDMFQKNTRSQSSSSQYGMNNNDDVVNRTRMPILPIRKGTKEWQLPHYNTLSENTTYLNHQLEMQQFGVVDAFTNLTFSTSMTEEEIRRVMDCVNWLLHSRREEMQKTDEMAEQFIRHEKEIHRKNNQIQTLTLQLDSERKSCTELDNQMNAKDAAYAKEKLIYKEEKRSLERKCIQLQHVDTNYKAQLRKSELAYERLQKQYNAHLNKATTDKRGIALGKELNSKTECSRVRVTNQKKTSGEHNIVNTMIRSYEAQQLQLIQENDTLRTSMMQFEAELKQIMQEYRSAAKWFLNRHGGSHELEQRLQLPYDEATSKNSFTLPINDGNNNSVLTAIHERMNMLRLKVRELKRATHECERDALEIRLREAIKMIEEQDCLIQQTLRLDFDEKSRAERLELSGLEGMLEDLAVERQDLTIKSQNMDHEREIFTRQAEQLDKERLDFEFERQNALQNGFNEFVRSDRKKRIRTEGDDPSNESVCHSPNTSFIPPTPATSRLLQRIGIIDTGGMISPIASGLSFSTDSNH